MCYATATTVWQPVTQAGQGFRVTAQRGVPAAPRQINCELTFWPAIVSPVMMARHSELQSGVINDYITWLVVGVAALGGILAVIIR